MKDEEKVEFEIEDESVQEVQNEQIENDVEIVDDTPEQDRDKEHLGDVEIPEDEISQYSKNVQYRLKQLSRNVHDERREKERLMREHQEAINYAKTVAEQNRQLQQRLSQGESVLIESHKDRVNARLSQAERDYKDAYEAGDSDKMLDAQKRLASYSAEQREVENYRPVYQASLQQQQNNVQIPQIVPDERTRRWVAQNDWFEKDREMRSFALGVHDDLVARGITPSSQEYFERIEKRVREVFPSKFGIKKPANVVAPASRSTGSSKITLNKTQVSIAKRLGVPLKEYAKYAMKEQSDV
jgi:hypothetical protein